MADVPQGEARHVSHFGDVTPKERHQELVEEGRGDGPGSQTASPTTHTAVWRGAVKERKKKHL